MRKMINYTTLSFFFLLLSFSLFNSKINNQIIPKEEENLFISDDKFLQPKSMDSFPGNILYSGTQNALELNETAILSDSTDLEIGNGSTSGYSSQNISLSVDTTHGWEANRYEATIEEIEDERNWLNNSGFDDEFIPSAKIDGPIEYAYDRNDDYATIQSTIDGNDCDYIRLYFSVLSFQPDVDYLYIWDEDYQMDDYFTGNYTDGFYTKWYNSSTMYLSVEADNSIQYEGYVIDYYEVYNGTFPDPDSWNYHSSNSFSPRLVGGLVNPDNNTAIFTYIHGKYQSAGVYLYNDFDESEFYQLITIPRGELIDAWFSFDYYMYQGFGNNIFSIF